MSATSTSFDREKVVQLVDDAEEAIVSAEETGEEEVVINLDDIDDPVVLLDDAEDTGVDVEQAEIDVVDMPSVLDYTDSVPAPEVLEDGVVHYDVCDDETVCTILESKVQCYDETKVSSEDIDEAMDDLRIRVCVRAAYEAYIAETYRQTQYQPDPWYRVMERPETLRPFVAFALGMLKSWKEGMSGRFERAAAGTGRFQQVRAKRYTRKYDSRIMEDN